MALLLFIASFLNAFLLVYRVRRAISGLKEIIIITVLLFSASLVFITEIISAMKLLSYGSLTATWLIIFLLTTLYLVSKRTQYPQIIKQLWTEARGRLVAFIKSGKAVFIAIFILLILVFVQGIVYPPNNWDSMTYHLARVTAWIGHQSVDHFPTHILRQLYQPPFAEYFILHINLLSRCDCFSNSVQFIYLIFCLPVILSLLDQAGLSGKYGLLAMVLLFTIPEVILQASSTQNDIVVSFFLLTSTLYAIKSFKESGFLNFLLLGISVGLAMFTKGTAYIFLAPVLLIFGIAILIITYKTGKFNRLVLAFAAAVIALSINAPQFTRNYQMAGNFMGVDETETKRYVNEAWGVEFFASNFIRNLSNHLGPNPISKISRKAVVKLHQWAGMDVNDLRTTFPGKVYKGAPEFPTHEDTAPNPIHFVLILFSLFLIAKGLIARKRMVDPLLFWLSLALLMQVLLFSAYLKWQPWHSRLHTPLFMLSIPLILYTLKAGVKHLWFQKIIMIALIFYAYLVVMFNYSRPIVPTRYSARISVTDNREIKLFANKPFLPEEYKAVSAEIRNSGFKNIGLILGHDDWEYPVFRNNYTKVLRPIHIKVENISGKLPHPFSGVDCIVSTTLDTGALEYMGKRFVNQSSGNKYIWLYR